MTIKSIAVKSKATINRHSSAILTSGAVVGVVATGYLSARAGYISALDIAKEDTDVVDPKQRIKENFALTWKNYIPPVAVGALTIASAIGSRKIDANRHASVLGLYSLTDRAFNEYRNKVEELYEKDIKGPKVSDILAQEAIDRNPPTLMVTSTAESMCYDSQSGRYFTSSIERLRKAENEINSRLIREMYVSLNDLYLEMGLEHIGYGDTVGWTAGEVIDLQFSSMLTDDKPCIVVGYRTTPKADYYKLG